MSPDTGITVRECASLEDYRQCVELQRTVWGFADVDTVPVRLFVVAHKIEGDVLGAFDPAGRMIGFTLAVPALRGRVAYLHSHMAAVLPEYRARGVGRRLKFEQRRRALERGIHLIEWTFDPLETGNAYFNIERLGAIARRYVVNQYGISSSPLHRGLPTDRLIAEWWLKSPRAIAASDGQAVSQPTIEERIAAAGALTKQEAPDAGVRSTADLQMKLRTQFQAAFARGLTVVAFERSPEGGTYLLGRWRG